MYYLRQTIDFLIKSGALFYGMKRSQKHISVRLLWSLCNLRSETNKNEQMRERKRKKILKRQDNKTLTAQKKPFATNWSAAMWIDMILIAWLRRVLQKRGSWNVSLLWSGKCTVIAMNFGLQSNKSERKNRWNWAVFSLLTLRLSRNSSYGKKNNQFKILKIFLF